MNHCTVFLFSFWVYFHHVKVQATLTYFIPSNKHPRCGVVLNFTLPCHRRQEIGSIYEAQLTTRSKTYSQEIPHRYGGCKLLVFLKHSFDHMSRKFCQISSTNRLETLKVFCSDPILPPAGPCIGGGSISSCLDYRWLHIGPQMAAAQPSHVSLTFCRTSNATHKSPMFHVHVPVQGPM